MHAATLWCIGTGHRNLDDEYYGHWVEQCGEPASPLLWSHAMYLRLHHALRDRR